MHKENLSQARSKQPIIPAMRSAIRSIGESLGYYSWPVQPRRNGHIAQGEKPCQQTNTAQLSMAAVLNKQKNI